MLYDCDLFIAPVLCMYKICLVVYMLFFMIYFKLLFKIELGSASFHLLIVYDTYVFPLHHPFYLVAEHGLDFDESLIQLLLSKKRLLFFN